MIVGVAPVALRPVLVAPKLEASGLTAHRDPPHGREEVPVQLSLLLEAQERAEDFAQALKPLLG